ncbi:unnamed protein product, partial [Brassica rapa subsp. trilocularis]
VFLRFIYQASSIEKKRQRVIIIFTSTLGERDGSTTNGGLAAVREVFKAARRGWISIPYLPTCTNLLSHLLKETKETTPCKEIPCNPRLFILPYPPFWDSFIHFSLSPLPPTKEVNPIHWIFS